MELHKYKKIVLGLLVVLIYILIFFGFFGVDSYVLIHDNLDSNLVEVKMLSESDNILGFNGESIPNIMGGLTRASFMTGFSVIVWLFKIFDPYWAYFINQSLMRIIAYFGMFLLLDKYILTKKQHNEILIGVSIAFAVLPFWPFGGLTIAGMPIALYSFLNIKNNIDSKFNWLTLILLPYYSYLSAGFVFFLTFIFLDLIYDSIKNKKINKKYLFSLILMSINFIIVEYRLIYDMFLSSEFISHRTEFDKALIKGTTFNGSILKTVKNFIYGQYHASSLQQYFIGFSVAISFIIMLVKKKINFKLISLLIVTFLISLLYGFWNWEGLNAFKNNISILRSFNFSRFHWLHPLFWYLIFAISLKFIQNNWKKYGKYIVVILLIGQISFLFYSSDFVTEYKRSGITYKEFYSESLFDEIDNYINEDKGEYRIASLGIYPEIALYNGFYTIDGYRFNYPLEYKHEFREIIEKELNKDNELKNYFDEWGSRCYIFSSELGKNFLYTKNVNKQIYNLEINTEQMSEMGVKFLLSAVKIMNYSENNLIYTESFENSISPWKIHLYKIK